MVKLLECKEHAQGEEFLIKIGELHSLEEVGIFFPWGQNSHPRGDILEHLLS